MNQHIIESILILLSCSVLAIILFRRFNLSPILGYLLVGILIGPHAFGFLQDSEQIHFLAEIGLVFLLFSISLEFSIHHFWAMRQTILGLGGAQMLFSSAIGAVAVWLSGIGWAGAIIAGGALAMSSTAIVVKQLDEQLELHSRHGRLTLGILLFQDLAVVPFLVAIPILAGSQANNLWEPFALALLKGVFALILLLLAGRWILRPLFHVVAAMRSTELFTLNILMVALAAAWITYQLGLSLALGAFLAGMMLSETEYRHQIETEIRAFRDILMALFFVSIGLQLNIHAALSAWPWVLLMLSGLIIGKGVLVFLLTRLSGQDWGVALRTGMALAQGGEFGLALLALALNRGLLSAQNSQVILATVILSMALAPIIIRYNGYLAKTLFTHTYFRQRIKQTRALGWSVRETSDHVILCGFGRVGQSLARFLRAEGIDYVALDLDPYIIRDAWEAGEHVFYGDSTHGEILRAAGLMRARVLVITFEATHIAERIIDEVRKRRPNLPILVRTLDETDLERLEAVGATFVFPEILESSMLIARVLLEYLNIPTETIDELIERERSTRYRHLRSRFRGETERIEEALHSVTLPDDSAFIGVPLKAIDLPSWGIHIEAVRRTGILGEEPDPDMYLQAGDVLVLRGPDDKLVHAEKELTSPAPPRKVER